MQNLMRHLNRKIKVLNYLFWNKAVIVANLYEHELTNVNYEYKPNIDGYYIGIDEQIFDNYSGFFPRKSLAFMRDRFFKYHDACIAFVVEKEIVYWAFITCRRKYHEPTINDVIDIPEDAALIYDTTTLDDFKRKGIHASAFRQVFEKVVELGKKKVVMMVLNENIPAINNLRKFNFKLIRRYIYFPLFSVTISWKKSNGSSFIIFGIFL